MTNPAREMHHYMWPLLANTKAGYRLLAEIHLKSAGDQELEVQGKCAVATLMLSCAGIWKCFNAEEVKSI